MFFLYLDLPYRDQSLPGSLAQEERAQGRCAGSERRVRRGVRPAGPGTRRAGGSESRARFDAAAVGRADFGCAGKVDAAGAYGFRAQALPRSEAAHRGRDFAYDGRDREEYAVSGHAEIARAVGGHEVRVPTSRKRGEKWGTRPGCPHMELDEGTMKCEWVRENITLQV